MCQGKVLVCRGCGREFAFTAGEQEYYAIKGFCYEPTRCKECRAKHKAGKIQGENGKMLYMAICADCGKECQVPFVPRGDKPVYCDECFAWRRAN